MKKKRINRTREQIIADLHGSKKFQEDMSFVKDQFYPALCEASKSIDDATMFLSSINTIMMEEFLGFMKDKTFGDLKLESKLDPKDEKHEELKKLLTILSPKSVYEAKSYIEGMRSEIQLFLNEENKERPLKSLKTNWLSELK